MKIFNRLTIVFLLILVIQPGTSRAAISPQRPQSSQSYVIGRSYGYLRALSAGDIRKGRYSSQDIVILSEIPLDIGPVAGLISTVPQTLHSHVMLRTLNQKAPNIYIPQGLSLKQIRKYLGKLVEFQVEKTGRYTLKGEDVLTPRTLRKKAETFWQNRVPSLPPLDSDPRNQILLFWAKNKMSKDFLPAYGTKGVHFALMDNILRERNEKNREDFKEGFLIPFFFYYQHVTQGLTEKLCEEAQRECSDPLHCGKIKKLCLGSFKGKEDGNVTLWDFIHELVQGNEFQSNVPFRKMGLKFIRNLIQKAPLDEESFDQIRQALSVFPRNKRIRLRSSTNMEDLPGMNGAGLYDSESVCPADEGAIEGTPGKGRMKEGMYSLCLTRKEIDRKLSFIQKLKTLEGEKNRTMANDLNLALKKPRPLSRALKKVFASLWTEKAFLYRQYFGVDHFRVYMGIIVHPSTEEESANGVVVVTRGRKTGDLEATIVVQKDDYSVTGPLFSWVRPEVIKAVLKKGGGSGKEEWVQASNLMPKGKKVLSAAMAQELLVQIEKVLIGLDRMEKYSLMENMSKVNREKLQKILEGKSDDDPLPNGEIINPTFDVEFIVSPKNQIQLKQIRTLDNPSLLGG